MIRGSRRPWLCLAACASFAAVSAAAQAPAGEEPGTPAGSVAPPNQGDARDGQPPRQTIKEGRGGKRDD